MNGARSPLGERAPSLRGDHVLGKPSTAGGYGSATVGREVTCRLWSGGRMGSSLSIMGAGKAAERWELLPCPCGHGASASATIHSVRRQCQPTPPAPREHCPTKDWHHF